MECTLTLANGVSTTYRCCIVQASGTLRKIVRWWPDILLDRWDWHAYLRLQLGHRSTPCIDNFVW